VIVFEFSESFFGFHWQWRSSCSRQKKWKWETTSSSCTKEGWWITFVQVVAEFYEFHF